MNHQKSPRVHSTTRRRRKLRKEIKNTIKAALIGTIGGIALVAMFFGAVIQESETLHPVTAVEVAE